MEFRNSDSHADKLKLYEKARKSLAETYADEPAPFSPASVCENSGKNLDDVNENDLRAYQVKVKTEKEQIKRGYYILSRVQERVYNLRQIFSEAFTTDRRSGSGQITIDYH